MLRNLHKIQAGRGVNSPGLPDPPVVFEELLVNALVHRDYLISAPIRLFVFDNRIEIISPGTLPNNLTVENIRAGNSNLRNPILASFVAKGVLPYRGLGSGVPRALEAWPDIDLRDDRDGGLFAATVRRKVVSADLHGDLHGPATGQVTEQVLKVVENVDGEVTRQGLQDALSLGNRDHFRKAYLLPTLEAGLIEMTRPDKPNSRSQRYRLTTAGKELQRQRGTTR
ncbi:MAG: Fic family protein [Myxococcales bacterium]